MQTNDSPDKCHYTSRRNNKNLVNLEEVIKSSSCIKLPDIDFNNNVKFSCNLVLYALKLVNALHHLVQFAVMYPELFWTNWYIH